MCAGEASIGFLNAKYSLRAHLLQNLKSNAKIIHGIVCKKYAMQVV